MRDDGMCTTGPPWVDTVRRSDGWGERRSRQMMLCGLILLLLILMEAEMVGAKTSSPGSQVQTTPTIPVLIIWTYFHDVTSK